MRAFATASDQDASGRDQDARARVLVVDALEGQDPLERGHTARAELGACGAPERVQGLRSGPGGPVDARRQHRVERVRDVDDPAAERELLALQAVGGAGGGGAPRGGAGGGGGGGGGGGCGGGGGPPRPRAPPTPSGGAGARR